MTFVRGILISTGCVGLLLLWVFSFAGATVTVHVREHSLVRSAVITLGDLALIEGENEQTVKRLNSIDLGKSPMPGETKEISPRYLQAKIGQTGIDLSSITLTLPEKVEVMRDACEISSEKIEEIIRSFIITHMPWDPEQTSITVSAPNAVALPMGEVGYEVIPSKNEDYLGSTNFLLVLMVDKKVAKKMWVPAQIEVTREIIMSAHPLPKGSIITEADIRLKKEKVSELSYDAVSNPVEAIGLRVKRAVEANVPLRFSFLELPPVVKRGDLVTIVAESDTLKITTQGMVIENGGRGDMVRVVNTSSRKELYGRVKDSQTIEVDF